MALPPSWKSEVQSTVDKASTRCTDTEKRTDERSQKIAAGIEVLTDELKRYNSKQERDETGKRCRQNWTIGGLIATAVFTFCLAGFSLWQVIETRRAYGPIEEAAAAAKTSANVARDAFYETQRAYIAVGFPTPIPKSAEEWRVNVMLTNIGTGFGTVLEFCYAFDDSDVLPPLPLEHLQCLDEATTLFPDFKPWIGLAGNPFLSPFTKEGQFFYGYVRYRDKFRRIWKGYFAVQVRRNPPPNIHYFHPAGGDAYHDEIEEK
jgi:hypothetical protein